MRLDKFLKVSRLIKRRTVANTVSEMGRVLVNGNPAKPAKQLKIGDVIEIEYSNRSYRGVNMPVINEHFTINTQGNNDIINITKHVQNCVYQHELKDALVCVSIQGSTSAVTTIEYETGLIQDLKEALERIAPTGAEYHHDEIWHDGNGYAHVRAAIVGSSVNIALKDGLLNLGTWQQVVLLDFDNKQRSRNITVQILY